MIRERIRAGARWSAGMAGTPVAREAGRGTASMAGVRKAVSDWADVELSAARASRAALEDGAAFRAFW